jgi:DICT domain-containing protein
LLKGLRAFPESNFASPEDHLASLESNFATLKCHRASLEDLRASSEDVRAMLEGLPATPGDVRASLHLPLLPPKKVVRMLKSPANAAARNIIAPKNHHFGRFFYKA